MQFGDTSLSFDSDTFIFDCVYAIVDFYETSSFLSEADALVPIFDEDAFPYCFDFISIETF